MTTRKNGSGTLLYRQGYDLKNRLVEADADGDADADLRLAYNHQEGRVARRLQPRTGYDQAACLSTSYGRFRRPLRPPY